ncbi:MAG: hypothetical protein ACLQIB_15700 [Isosphaeraceae bacterium]
MRDWMHLQLPLESRSRPEPVPIAKMRWTGEIGENAPNEANFAESMSIVEAQDPIQVTANPRARSRLDKQGGAAWPVENHRNWGKRAPNLKISAYYM